MNTWIELIDPKKHTKRNCFTGLQEIVDFTGLNHDELIEEAGNKEKEGIFARYRTTESVLHSENM